MKKAVTILVGFDFGTVDIQPIDDEWSSGEEIPVVLVDGDANKNSRADEDLDLNNPNVTLIPSLQTGDPFTLGEGSNSTKVLYANVTADPAGLLGITINGTTGAGLNSVGVTSTEVDDFSKIARVTPTNASDVSAIIIDYQTTLGDLRSTLGNTNSTTAGDRLQGFNFFSMDIRSFNSSGTFDVYLLNNTSNIIGTDSSIHASTGNLKIATGLSAQSGLVSLNGTATDATSATPTINNGIFNDNISDDNVVGLLILNTVAGQQNR